MQRGMWVNVQSKKAAGAATYNRYGKLTETVLSAKHISVRAMEFGHLNDINSKKHWSA